MSTTITVPCPPWCKSTPDEHAEEMRRGDCLVHWSEADLATALAAAATVTDAEGVETDPPTVHILTSTNDTMSEAEAHELGMALVRSADLLRRGRNR